MSTIHFRKDATLTPEQYIAGLTDFSAGRSKVFNKSTDDYLKVLSLDPIPVAKQADTEVPTGADNQIRKESL